MVAADGQAHLKAVQTRNAMLFLLLLGIALSVGVIAVVGPKILRPIASLRRSVSEIQKGNLDLVVKVPSRDEIGQLAEAFNDMAASLREFRRSDRAQLLRSPAVDPAGPEQPARRRGDLRPQRPDRAGQ